MPKLNMRGSTPDDPEAYLSFELTPDQIEARRNAPTLDAEADSAGLLIDDYFRQV